MICPKCSAAVAVDDTFCAKCGSKVEEAPARKRSTLKIAGYVIGVLLVGGFIGNLMDKKSNSGGASAPQPAASPSVAALPAQSTSTTDLPSLSPGAATQATPRPSGNQTPEFTTDITGFWKSSGDDNTGSRNATMYLDIKADHTYRERNDIPFSANTPTRIGPWNCGYWYARNDHTLELGEGWLCTQADVETAIQTTVDLMVDTDSADGRRRADVEAMVRHNSPTLGPKFGNKLGSHQRLKSDSYFEIDSNDGETLVTNDHPTGDDSTAAKPGDRPFVRMTFRKATASTP